jgi:hypothetical protein
VSPFLGVLFTYRQKAGKKLMSLEKKQAANFKTTDNIGSKRIIFEPTLLVI